MARIDEAVAAVAAAGGAGPRVALVLGSGLGGLAAEVEDARRTPCGDIPHWPVSGVPGHAGVLVTGRLAGVPVAVLSGRVHAYEGHDPAAVVRPVRTLARVGVRCFVLTNAAGGIRPDLRPGDLMWLDDHLNLTGANPLRGPNLDALGPRFPDMSAVYEASWAPLAEEAARAAGLGIHRGVYAALAGPSFETPAEIRMLRALGADAVGMSTVPEAIALRHAGAKVAALSLVTNLAAGTLPQPLSHEEVMETGARVRPRLRAMLRQFVSAVAEREGIR
jgi:purine-nucleoside phosphorylase